MTDCTIVLATNNRRDALDETLTKLGALPERPPVIVVDNASTDGTAPLVKRRHPEVRVMRLSENIGAAARTEGVRRASTSYVAFCDDDCSWRPGAIERAVSLLDQHREVALLCARVLVRAEHVDEACELMAASPLPKRSACPGSAIASFMAGASVVRRDAFLAAGGYHQRYHIGAEESLLALDLLADGWEMIYSDDLVVDHYPAAAGRAPERRRRLVMRNRLWTTWLRRSWGAAWRATFGLVRQGTRDPVARAALGDAVRGLPWVLRERRPVDPQVEALLEGVTELPA
ncbi:MAG TPA: glycosyltransferase family 2 protein [Candidatus Limnocylindria bacterium]|nr:glycosyltransferase family 2 protein [Candidatus Limnocylindria bacterium]